MRAISSDSVPVLASTVQAGQITEGLATISPPADSEVFYNPIQQFNRDLSILAIRAWSEHFEPTRKRKRDESGSQMPQFTILEGLAASGLRSVRYACEIPNVKTILANDLSQSAYESIKANAELNNVGHIIKPRLGDARAILAAPPQKVHVIDLDPYGTAAPFIDGAVSSVANGGLLCITCTDLAVLAGNSYPEKCFSLYGGTTVRNDALHESALRLLLGLVSSTAARYGRVVEPLLSLSIDYYVRVFVTVRDSPVTVKQHIGKMATIRCCNKCQTTVVQPLGRVDLTDKAKKYKYAQAVEEGNSCKYCQSTINIAGPMYTGALHNEDFVSRTLAQIDQVPSIGTASRIKGMLSLAKQELATPFYVSPSRLCSQLHSPIPSLAVFCSALLNGGYNVSLTHAQPGCVKTDAPNDFLWAVAFAWAKSQGPPKQKNTLIEYLEGAELPDVSFERNAAFDKLEQLRKAKMTRYHQPPKNWGPQSRPSKGAKPLENETA